MNGLLLTGAWFTIVVGVSGFAYWASCKIADAVETINEAVDLLAEDREFSRAAAEDAHNGATILRTWWSEAVLYETERQQPEPQPATQPHLPPTMPQHRAAGRIDDVTLAWELARLEQIMRGDLEVGPRKRTGSTASRKAS